MKKKKSEKPLRFHRIEHPRIYGQDDIALSNAKVNIHIRLDADILAYFKNLAQQKGGKYQSLINQHLRQTIFGEQNIESRLQRVEEALGIAHLLPKTAFKEAREVPLETNIQPKEEQAIVSLLDKDPELRKFYEEHRELERKLAEYQHKYHLTPDEMKIIQKLNHNEKDRVMKILERYTTWPQPRRSLRSENDQ